MSKPTIEQMEEFFAQIRGGRMTSDIFQRVLENPDRYNDKLGRFGPIFPTTVNTELGLARLIKDARQNFVNDSIVEKNFPVERCGIREVNLEYYEFDRTVKCPEGVEEIEANGYQLEGPAELAVFIKANPMEQLRRPIVVWKTHWQDPGGGVYVPYAYQGGDERDLRLAYFEGEFSPHWRVLVSRKE